MLIDSDALIMLMKWDEEQSSDGPTGTLLSAWRAGFERSPRSIASKFLTCVWFAFVTVTLVTYTAGIVNSLYWASMTHRPPSTRARYVDLAHVVNSKDIDYGTTLNSHMYRSVNPLMHKVAKMVT